MAERYTINQLLVLMKEVRSRVNDLRQIRQSCTVQERTYFGTDMNNRKEVTPQYDVKSVDRKVTELETWLFKADAAIKQANAMTKVEVDVDVDKLLEPLQ